MIPKIIHYCWFGNKPLPRLAKKCIASWKKYCPDYEIKRWDESNFDINCCSYVKYAYQIKKYAFVSDYVRLYALVNYGGIYMDIDVEVIKPIDEFLKYKAFSGFESKSYIQTGIMACEKKHELFEEFLREYDDSFFVKKDESFFVPNVVRITNTCLKYGLILNNKQQTVKDFTLFPKEYFCPIWDNELIITNNTYTIHHYMASWCKFSIKRSIYRFLCDFIGRNNANIIQRKWHKLRKLIK